ncbi:hypothetical protein [Candidatus Poriferisodalis sp.]|uniref:hypothetical protein n=1 Tax=Candidatus Poriferisodalis sp. TaxID=3101277 RepID=UPI003D0F97A3
MSRRRKAHRARPRHQHESPLPPGSRYIGPAPETASAGASLDCATCEAPDGPLLTLHRSPSLFSDIDAGAIRYNDLDLQAAVFASKAGNNAIGEAGRECPGLVGSAFGAVMTSGGPDRRHAAEAFVSQRSEVCDDELPEHSDEAKPWQ